VRREQSGPLIARFFAWCDGLADYVLDDTPLAAAVRYARNQRSVLSRFLDDARLPLDNNLSERALRRQVLGRHNWLFLGSDEAAEVNTTFVSLLASCQLHGLEPWTHLRDLFCLLPAPRPRARARPLAANPPAAGHSGAARHQSPPRCHHCARSAPRRRVVAHFAVAVSDAVHRTDTPIVTTPHGDSDSSIARGCQRPPAPAPVRSARAFEDATVEHEAQRRVPGCVYSTSIENTRRIRSAQAQARRG